MRTRWSIGAFCVFFLSLCGFGFGQNQEIEFSETQHLRHAAGIVRDYQGAPIAGVHVELRERGSKKVLRSTETHLDGHFALRQLAAGKYDLYFQAKGFDPMLYHVRIDGNGSKDLLIVSMVVGT